MLVPKPPFTLEGHCSVMNDGILYVYSSDGFASIPLERNGTWTELRMGEPVSGAACVKGGVDGDNNKAALWVVGGESSSSDYQGLQKYSFSDQKWESISTVTADIKNRRYHGATYLKSTSSILVYAGSRNGDSGASTETFVISTAEPYGVLSYISNGAPPAASPILVPWNDEEAALVGGFSTTNQIYLFSVTGGWRNSGAALADPLPSNVRAALVSGSDGSKVLESFHMDVSPNTVESVALLTAGGIPANPARAVGASSSRKHKRNFTLGSFPTYNDAYASTTERPDYSLAQGGNDLVVISSGGGTDSLAIFNQSANSWVNATKLFYGDQSIQQILTSTTATSTSSLPSATGSSSNSTTTAAGSSSGSSTGTIIAATLGSILGLAAILIAILLYLRHVKKQRKQAAQAQGGSNDKDRLSFQDQGIEPLARSAYPMAKGPVPLASASVDSLALFGVKTGDEKSLKPTAAGHGQGQTMSSQPKKSPLSTVQASRHFSTGTTFSDTLGNSSGGGRPGDRRTNEGWSKYFQDNSATNLVGMQSSTRDTLASEVTKTDYRGSAWPMANLPPLKLGFLDEPTPLGRVATGSPTTASAYSDEKGRSLIIPESQSARISSASSISLVSSDDDYDRRDEFSSGVPDSVREDSHWLGTGKQQSWIDRPPSSTYSSSYYNPDPQHNSWIADPPHRASGNNEPNSNDGGRSNARRSSLVIPEDLDEPPPPPSTNINPDMSWLNLNAAR